MFLGLINLLERMKKIHSFLHRRCYEFLNACVLDFYVVSGLITLSSWLFFGFQFVDWSRLIFYFSVGILLVLPLGLDLFASAYLNKFTVYVVPSN